VPTIQPLPINLAFTFFSRKCFAYRRVACFSLH
jgi:hypothetical protein